MAATKKPRKPHRKCWNAGGVLLKSEPWKVRAVFGPLERILDQLEQDGTIDVAARDERPIFQDSGGGGWYCTVTALNGVIEAYEIHERRHQRQLGLEPLRILANKLQCGMSIFSSDIEACRASLNRMRLETMQMTSDYAKQLIKDFQIKEQLEKVAA